MDEIHERAPWRVYGLVFLMVGRQSGASIMLAAIGLLFCWGCGGREDPTPGKQDSSVNSRNDADRLVGLTAQEIVEVLGEPLNTGSAELDVLDPETDANEIREWEATTVAEIYVYETMEVDFNVNGKVIAIRPREPPLPDDY